MSDKEAIRRVSIFVENKIGVLAKISGLFAGKNYNIHTLTVGTTEDPTISRMTISIVSDDNTFEQIKKQLNRCVEVIKVMDFTQTSIHMKEVLFVRVNGMTLEGKNELLNLSKVFDGRVVDYGKDSALFECCQTELKNDSAIRLLKDLFKDIEVVRGGTVAIESISMADK